MNHQNIKLIQDRIKSSTMPWVLITLQMLRLLRYKLDETFSIGCYDIVKHKKNKNGWQSVETPTTTKNERFNCKQFIFHITAFHRPTSGFKARAIQSLVSLSTVQNECSQKKRRHKKYSVKVATKTIKDFINLSAPLSYLLLDSPFSILFIYFYFLCSISPAGR